MTTKQKNRTPGYYWVRHKHFGWVVAWFRTDYQWSFEIEFYQDDEFEEIDERKIERNRSL